MKTAETINGLIKDLNFLSETDDLWTLFSPRSRRTAITPQTMMTLTGLAFDKTLKFDAFMDHTIRSQTVSQGAEVGTRYEILKKELTALLTQRIVFKMVNSPNNYEYYVVGVDKDNNLVGCNVTSVET